MKTRLPAHPVLRGALCTALSCGCLLLSGHEDQSWAIDADGDGMSDVWQQQHNIVSGDINSDPDRDGFSNLIEAQFRTDPNPNSSPETDMQEVGLFMLQGDVPVIYWHSFVGLRYVVEHNFDLQDWSSVSVPLDGIGGVFAYCAEPFLSSSYPRQFFHVSVLPAEDIDEDGLDAWEENELGTDDNDPDTDHDGYCDGYENLSGADPLSHDGAYSPPGPTGLVVFTPGS